eukprot:TRINITY_DN1734_c0_g1_i1.p1 TRINITY_DN1734_c0_g1~~TRINITY_DN1734_c0_g1_i1.p1  ORF type:complete len:985 (-),score=331.41 TRINITY_DN1734_c0_g1_i1:360-3314(-)
MGRTLLPAQLPADPAVVSKMTVVQLKQKLKEAGLPVSGVKAVLVKRLVDHLAANQNSSAASQCSAPNQSCSWADASEGVRVTCAPAPSKHEQVLKRWSVAQLKHRLREAHLPVTGLKSVLVARLAAHLESSGEAATRNAEEAHKGEGHHDDVTSSHASPALSSPFGAGHTAASGGAGVGWNAAQTQAAWSVPAPTASSGVFSFSDSGVWSPSGMGSGAATCKEAEAEAEAVAAMAPAAVFGGCGRSVEQAVPEWHTLAGPTPCSSARDVAEMVRGDWGSALTAAAAKAEVRGRAGSVEVSVELFEPRALPKELEMVLPLEAQRGGGGGGGGGGAAEAELDVNSFDLRSTDNIKRVPFVRQVELESARMERLEQKHVQERERQLSSSEPLPRTTGHHLLSSGDMAACDHDLEEIPSYWPLSFQGHMRKLNELRANDFISARDYQARVRQLKLRLDFSHEVRGGSGSGAGASARVDLASSSPAVLSLNALPVSAARAVMTSIEEVEAATSMRSLKEAVFRLCIVARANKESLEAIMCSRAVDRAFDLIAHWLEGGKMEGSGAGAGASTPHRQECVAGEGENAGEESGEGEEVTVHGGGSSGSTTRTVRDVEALCDAVLLVKVLTEHSVPASSKPRPQPPAYKLSADQLKMLCSVLSESCAADVHVNVCDVLTITIRHKDLHATFLAAMPLSGLVERVRASRSRLRRALCKLVGAVCVVVPGRLSGEQWEAAVGLAEELLDDPHDVVRRAALACLEGACDVDGEHTRVRAETLERVVHMVLEVAAAARVLGSLAMHDDAAVCQRVVDAGAMPKVAALLGTGGGTERDEAEVFWLASNVMHGTVPQMRAAVEAGLVLEALRVLRAERTLPAVHNECLHVVTAYLMALQEVAQDGGRSSLLALDEAVGVLPTLLCVAERVACALEAGGEPLRCQSMAVRALLAFASAPLTSAAMTRDDRALVALHAKRLERAGVSTPALQQLINALENY